MSRGFQAALTAAYFAFMTLMTPPVAGFGVSDAQAESSDRMGGGGAKKRPAGPRSRAASRIPATAWAVAAVKDKPAAASCRALAAGSSIRSPSPRAAARRSSPAKTSHRHPDVSAAMRATSRRNLHRDG